MDTMRVAALSAWCATAAAGSLVPPPLAAQEDAAAAPSMTCWRGAPRPACAGFFVVEAQGVLPILSSSTPFGLPGGMVSERDAFESRLEWNLGYMVNVSPEWAVGGAVSLGTGSYDALTGLRARARRWLDPQVGLEVQAGLLKTHAANLGGLRPLNGLTADVRLNVGDRASFFARWDGVQVPRGVGFDGTVFHPGGFEQALHVGVGTGSTWTVVGSGLLALWYLAAISAVATS